MTERTDNLARRRLGRAGREVTPGTSSRSALEVQAGRWAETGRTVTLNRYGTTTREHRPLRATRRPPAAVGAAGPLTYG
jgi:hypothetical protein